MFLGKITKWDDPAIAKLNPDVKLPSTAITVCHRSDDSGTTKLFTTFLAAYSPAWKNGPGVDKTVKWPTGTGAKGNDGVAACVKQTDGGLGYVEQAYALANNFTYASVKNKSGNFVEPTLESTSAAGDGLRCPTTCASAPSTRRATRRTRSPRARSSSSTRTCASQACPRRRRRASRHGSTTRSATVRPWPRSCSTRRCPTNIKTKAKAKVDGLVCNGSADRRELS